jgi:hypothetical protein
MHFQEPFLEASSTEHHTSNTIPAKLLQSAAVPLLHSCLPLLNTVLAVLVWALV